MRWLLGALALAFLLAGCPRELEAPPAAGDPCTRLEDCNPAGLDCGELRLCVSDRCEDTPSLRRPCR